MKSHPPQTQSRMTRTVPPEGRELGTRAGGPWGEGMTPLGWRLIWELEADLGDLICWLTLLSGRWRQAGVERLPASSLAAPEDGEEGRRAGRKRRLPLPSWAVSPGASAGNFQEELSLKPPSSGGLCALRPVPLPLCTSVF